MNRGIVRILLASVGGLVMALGLGIAGLTNPGRIIGFLDFTGRWDPTALFLMAGAAVVFGVGFQLQARRAAGPYVSVPPPTRPVDARLLSGAALFGVGWGLSGFCPGPSIVALAGGAVPVVVFVIAMGGGILLQSWLQASRWSSVPSVATSDSGSPR